MKCYCLVDELDYDGPVYKIVFANTRGQAKSKARLSGDDMYNFHNLDCDYTDIKCLRYPLLDNHENDTEKNIMRILIKEYNWCFTTEDDFYDLDNLEKFEKDF